MTPLVVYLAYLPYGPEMPERFLASYVEHRAGRRHKLLVVQKGEGAPLPLLPKCESVSVPDDRLDLGTYLWVARNIEAPRYLFLNTSSVILGDEWLKKLDRHLGGNVGMVGASGSHGSSVDQTKGYPNPHMRTTAFMLERDLLLDLDWLEPIETKDDAYAVENGPRSLTSQVIERGLEAMVVGCDGEGYPVARWPESNTFWAGDQSNLLIADKGTLRYHQTIPGLPIYDYRAQRRMSLAAWGTLDRWIPT